MICVPGIRRIPLGPFVGGSLGLLAPALLALALATASTTPASALTPDELLGKIFPKSSGPQAKRSRMKPPAAISTAKPPLPAPKPDDAPAPATATPPADTPPKPEASPGPSEPPVPEPDPRPEVAPEPKAEAAPREQTEPTPEQEPAPVAAPQPPPEAAAPLDESVVPPTAPLGEPMPPAGTVIAPADALGPVIPPVQPAPEPPLPPAPKPAAEPAEGDATPKPTAKPDAPHAASNEPPRYLPTADELAACSAGMPALAITATAEPPIVEGDCGAPDPFKVTALQAGAVNLAPAATIDCAMASALARWVTDDVQSAAKAAFGAPVTTIDVAGSYTCRGRNNVVGAKLSEHAFANAIDIAGFKLGDRTVNVAKSDGQSATDAAFIELIRLAACRRFTTVLGPGSDVEHASHLHLDTIKRGRSGDYRICE